MTDWKWPIFEVDAALIKFHNKTATKHKGNQVTWVMAAKLGGLKSLVESRNRGVYKARNADLEHCDIPGAIQSLVHSYYRDLSSICSEIVNNLQVDLGIAERTGQNPRAGEKSQIPLVVDLCLACGLKPAKSMNKRVAAAALRLPMELKQVLGLNLEELLKKTNPAVVIRIGLIEKYLAEFYRVMSDCNEMRDYVYDGPVPEDPLDDLAEIEAAPSWDAQEHTVTT